MTRSRDRGSKVAEPTTTRHFSLPGIWISLYAPWWSPARNKRELGFCIRIKDPRATCEHLCEPLWCGPEDARCSRCYAKLDVIAGSRTIDRPHAFKPRWRWLKIFVASTSSPRKKHKHGVFVAEAETHLTAGLSGRISTKTFARFKFGVGGRYV